MPLQIHVAATPYINMVLIDANMHTMWLVLIVL